MFSVQYFLDLWFDVRMFDCFPRRSGSYAKIRDSPTLFGQKHDRSFVSILLYVILIVVFNQWWFSYTFQENVTVETFGTVLYTCR